MPLPVERFLSTGRLTPDGKAGSYEWNQMTALNPVRSPTTKESLAIAEMLAYFFTRWKRRRWKKYLDSLEPIPIAKMKNVFTGKYHRIHLKAVIAVFFSLHSRGNNIKGTCNMYRARRQPQLGVDFLRCIEELARLNAPHLEAVRTVVNTPQDNPTQVEVLSTFQFDTEKSAKSFVEQVSSNLLHDLSLTL